MQALRLIRPLNLIMILFTQYMVRFVFLYPVFKVTGFSLQLNEVVFFFFSFSFVLIAAGGYIINDYYDRDIDKVNKPGKVVIGAAVSPSQALTLYWVISITGLVMGCWSSYKAGLPMLGLLFFIYFAGLWFYSTTLKYLFLIGNIVIALFLALVPFTTGFSELYVDVKTPLFSHTILDISFLLYGIIGISLFAFFSTLVREIVKDMEDMEGDAKAGCHTIPIVLGIKNTKRVVQSLLLIMFLLLAYLQYRMLKVDDIKSFIYFTCFIQFLILFLIWKMGKSFTTKDFHKLSLWLKILMVAGISYLFVFAYLCSH